MSQHTLTPPSLTRSLAQPPTLLLLMLRRMWLVGTDVYLLAALIYVLFRITVGDESVVITLGNIFLPWAMLPAWVLLPVLLALSAWRRAAAVGLIVAAFLMLFGGLFLPNVATVRAAHNDTLMKIITFNSAGRYTHPEDLIAYINAENPDIMALIELSPDNAAVIDDTLSALYPHRVVVGDGVGGKALLSRYPIIQSESFTLRTDRPNIEAMLQTPSGPMTVFVAHPPSPDFTRSLNFYAPDPDNRAEIDMLLARADATPPTLLLGDFNITDQSAAYASIRQAGYTDSFREVGFGFGTTYHQHALGVGGGRYIWLWRDPAIVRIDYIWHSDHFRTLTAQVGPNLRSDHRPVSAHLVLRAN